MQIQKRDQYCLLQNTPMMLQMQRKQLCNIVLSLQEKKYNLRKRSTVYVVGYSYNMYCKLNDHLFPVWETQEQLLKFFETVL
jgi:hypothetical protein